MTIIDAVVEIATCSAEIADTCMSTLMVLRITSLFADKEQEVILTRLFAYTDYSSAVLAEVDAMVQPDSYSLADLGDKLQQKAKVMKANKQGVDAFFRRFRVVCMQRFENSLSDDYESMFDCLPALP